MSAAGADDSLLSLEGRVALVTGAGGAIGASIAETLLRAGATLIATDLPGLSCPTGSISVPCDLSDPAAIESLVQSVEESHGRLDILVHCAGVTRDAVVWKMATEDWNTVMRINLDSAFHLLRHSAAMLRKSKTGAVVFISSINGERGKFGQANYAASKAGLIGLARTAAREFGRAGVRVNVIAPGLIDTPMTAGLPEEVKAEAVAQTVLGRAGTPGDVAGATLFLCSDLGRHVTGQVLRVDGGQLMA